MNPEATGYGQSQARLGQVQQHLLVANANTKILDVEATPLDISLLDNDQTLVYSDGGDGTVRKTIAAIAGIVPDDPERTARNFADFQAISSHLRYFAGAGGNANNWPLSAHARFAVHPDKLPQASTSLGFHRPIIYETTDPGNNIVRSNIVTCCLGFAASAIAAQRLEKAKPLLRDGHSANRLLGEIAIVVGAARDAPPFAIELSSKPEGLYGNCRINDLIGFELISSRRYAKQGRTHVNVNDTRLQPILLHRSGAINGKLQLVNTFARLKSGRHVLPTEDLHDRQLSIRIVSEDAVQFHAGGETNDDSVIQPGQTLHLRLARIAIPTLMAS